MFLKFSKYVGTGNDFIVVNCFDEALKLNLTEVPKLCHRQYGIGADGLILAHSSNIADAYMRIINNNGKEAEMCGNGLRCFVDFLYRSRKIGTQSYIETQSKTYKCVWKKHGVTIEMGLPKIEKEESNEFLINVGVPHLVVFVKSLDQFDEEAKKRFSLLGININYAKLSDDRTINMRTFERGVEAETLSCGTGATAACVAAAKYFKLSGDVEAEFQSGEKLQFNLITRNKKLQELHMTGQVTHVFDGTIKL